MGGGEGGLWEGKGGGRGRHGYGQEERRGDTMGRKKGVYKGREGEERQSKQEKRYEVRR